MPEALRRGESDNFRRVGGVLRCRGPVDSWRPHAINSIRSPKKESAAEA
jgi:hypothetical protein